MIVCLTIVSLEMYIATFRLLLQAMRSTDYTAPFISRRSAVIGAFRSSHRFIAPTSSSSSVVRFCAVFLLLCFLILDIHASRISIPLSLLMLLGWSLTWIASLTPRVYQWGSRSINLTSFQIEYWPVSWACSKMGEVWVQASRIFLSFSFRRSFCFPDVDFAALYGNPIDYGILFSWIDGVLYVTSTVSYQTWRHCEYLVLGSGGEAPLLLVDKVKRRWI